MYVGDLIPEVKRVGPEAGESFTSSAQLKNECICASSRLEAFMSCTGTTILNKVTIYWKTSTSLMSYDKSRYFPPDV